LSRVAVVTGGASGIGLGVARRFADDGSYITGQLVGVNGGMYI
jgi:NADP-dependent 3-hydroxy acid dehydrogenase YdfG